MGFNSAIRDVVRQAVDELRPTLRNEVAGAIQDHLRELERVQPRANDGLLTVADAAAFCGVTRGTIREWINAGQLRALLLPGGREYRIRRANLEQVLEAGKSQPERPSVGGQVSRILERTRRKTER